MKVLEDAIREKGKVLSGNILKVGSFLNNQIDVKLFGALAEDVKNHFNGKRITKVFTVEASGIAYGFAIAEKIGCELVFAKKNKTANLEGEFYSAQCFSFTHKTQNVLVVPKEYLTKEDCVLVADDFLATGEAVNALISIVESAGATLAGVTSAVEKGFQKGGDNLRNKGVDVYSLAVIDKMDNGVIEFRK